MYLKIGFFKRHGILDQIKLSFERDKYLAKIESVT